MHAQLLGVALWHRQQVRAAASGYCSSTHQLCFACSTVLPSVLSLSCCSAIHSYAQLAFDFIHLVLPASPANLRCPSSSLFLQLHPATGYIPQMTYSRTQRKPRRTLLLQSTRSANFFRPSPSLLLQPHFLCCCNHTLQMTCSRRWRKPCRTLLLQRRCVRCRR
jgi:hypothetical protein